MDNTTSALPPAPPSLPRDTKGVGSLLVSSSIDFCVRKNGRVECDERDPGGRKLACCLQEGGREGGNFAERSHGRTNLSHGIVSGFRIVSPLSLSHATRRDLRDADDRQRDRRRLSNCLDGVTVTAMPPTVRRRRRRRSVDFRINDLYLSTRRGWTKEEGIHRSRLLPQIVYLIVAS